MQLEQADRYDLVARGNGHESTFREDVEAAYPHDSNDLFGPLPNDIGDIDAWIATVNARMQ